MPSTNFKPGAEIEAWCTQCKADKVHRIIALVGTTPKKVECLSCKGHHMYRATQAQKDANAAAKRGSKAEKAPSASSAGASARAARPSRASISPKKREEDLLASWEKAVVGKETAAFKPYRIDKTFVKGDLIRHTKFGEGVVSAVVDATKFEILFKDGMKTLAQSMSLS
ncbi:MAG: hypothetical protein NVS3B20_13460 [Polyangiales bacterium]